MLPKQAGSLRVGWLPLAPIVGLFLSAGVLQGQGVSSSPNPTVSFSTPGAKQVSLTVCNAGGDCSRVTKSVVVLDPKPHIMGMNSLPPVVGTRQSFTLSALTTGRPALTYRWVWTGTSSLTMAGNPVVWNAATPGVGSYQVHIEVQNSDGSALSAPVPVQVVRMTFADVPPSQWYWKYVEGLFTAGITNGCDAVPNFCPDLYATRAHIAASLVRAVHGSGFVPPAATGLFADVPTTHWAAPYIEQLYLDGITTGCATAPPRFCPDELVTRAEMAPFMLRAKHGASYVPPRVANSSFGDVAADFWARDWIEQAYAEGITNGCMASPLSFCPSKNVTRAEMAGFLTKTFGLPLP